jgi:glycosyltransferase involved in cell wall biosynthesis
MKILFVLENYYPHIGGVEVLFKNLTEELVKKGQNLCCYTQIKKFQKI